MSILTEVVKLEKRPVVKVPIPTTVEGWERQLSVDKPEDYYKLMREYDYEMLIQLPDETRGPLVRVLIDQARKLQLLPLPCWSRAAIDPAYFSSLRRQNNPDSAISTRAQDLDKHNFHPNRDAETASRATQQALKVP